jgi:uncharacterized Fe-S cluster protein YjdI
MITQRIRKKTRNMVMDGTRNKKGAQPTNSIIFICFLLSQCQQTKKRVLGDPKKNLSPKNPKLHQNPDQGDQERIKKNIQ